MCGQEMAQLQHSQEFVEEVHTTEVCQASMITGDFYIRGEYGIFTNC